MYNTNYAFLGRIFHSRDSKNEFSSDHAFKSTGQVTILRNIPLTSEISLGALEPPSHYILMINTQTSNREACAGTDISSAMVMVALSSTLSLPPASISMSSRLACTSLSRGATSSVYN